jgi:hypothetical protein
MGAEGQFGPEHFQTAQSKLAKQVFPCPVFCLALGNLLLDDFSAADLSGMEAGGLPAGQPCEEWSERVHAARSW